MDQASANNRGAMVRIPFGNGNYGATRATLDRRSGVAERVLRVVRDADAHSTIVQTGPLMVLGVAQIVGHVHAR